MSKIKLVVWDMDGTLIDSASVVPDTFIATVLEFSGVQKTRTQIVELYSLGVPENILAHLLGETPGPEVMQYYYGTLNSGSINIGSYEGIAECLSELSKDVRLAVFTGASQQSAEALIGSTGLAKYFDLILGADGFPPKPDPTGLIEVASRLGVACEECVYIGDAPADIQAASAAKMMSIGAGWGHLFSRDCHPGRVAQVPAEVARFIASSQK